MAMPGEINHERLEQRASALVRVPSETGAEAAACDLLGTWLAEAGADEVDRWTARMSDLERDPAYPGREVDRDDVPVVAAKARGRNPGRTIVLTGHIDTVPAGENDAWSVDPYGGNIEDGSLFGLGACDMKAGLAAALEVFATLASADRDFSGEVRFVAVSGEEDGGTGTLAAIRRGWVGDCALIAEPTSNGGGPELIVAHGGALTFTVAVPGRSAHASKRHEGESALDHLGTVLGVLRALEADLNEAEHDPLMRRLGLPYPTSVGIVRGGSWASNVMDRVEIELRTGVRVGETIGEAETRFRRTLLDALACDPWLAAHPPDVSRTGAAFGSARIGSDHWLVAGLAGAAEHVTGRSPVLAGAPYGCDMALWMSAGGVPAVVYGPGDVRKAHAPDESVALAEVHQTAEVLLEAVMRLAGTH